MVATRAKCHLGICPGTQETTLKDMNKIDRYQDSDDNNQFSAYFLGSTVMYNIWSLFLYGISFI